MQFTGFDPIQNHESDNSEQYMAPTMLVLPHDANTSDKVHLLICEKKKGTTNFSVPLQI
jgi:hypothetical protein